MVVPAALVDRRRFVEDLDLLRQFGVGQVRIGVDWAWMQPKPGELHGEAVEFYLGAALAAREMGVVLQLTLLQRAVPAWFDNEGGFSDARFAHHWWPRWVEACAETFGDVIGGWVPIDHPLGVANALHPDDPRRHGEVLDTLITAWRDAWRILRGGPPVITAFGVEVVRPADQTVQAAEAARRFDQIRWRLWLDGLRTGNISIPGRADRELDDLAGACDVVGIIVRHEHDVLGLLHRTAEQAPERPLAVTFLLPTGADAGRESAVERYVAGTIEAASGLPLSAMSVSPAFDANDLTEPSRAQGIITRDRELKDSGRRFLGIET